MKIKIEHDPPEERLTELGVREWPIWSKGVSIFPWNYDSDETCFLLEGRAVITPHGGAPVEVGQNDLVVFPRGLVCTWSISKAVRKHYSFG